MSRLNAADPGYAGRLQKLSKSLTVPLLIKNAENLRYLCGFTGSYGLLLAGPEEHVFISDGRYIEQAARQVSPHCRVHIQKAGLAKALAEQGYTGKSRAVLGLEAESFTLKDLSTLQKDLGSVELIPLPSPVFAMRARKSRDEIDSIRQALRLTEEAMVFIAGFMQPEMTERQVAARLEYYCMSRGAESMAFPTILASGINSALPHAGLSDRVIGRNSLVQFDFGLKINGYCSDFSRVVYTGSKVPAPVARCWERVVEAQQRGFEQIREGVRSDVPENAVRAYFRTIRVQSYYTHSLGHGLGLAVHEGPRFSRLHPELLEAGMVMTVEPGLYYPGKWGIRIEDVVVVRAKGVEILTDFPREIACLG